ncbi:MAG: hypothetical protein GYB19_18600 [Rhodospirillales bacterium]|nr:hypothetical protein [Rhodospirillales bacterium]
MMTKNEKQKSGVRRGWFRNAMDFRRDHANARKIGNHTEELKAIYKSIDEYDQEVRLKWKTFQSFILRGLCGGLLASLTFVGSQLFTGPLKTNVAILTAIFILGLAIQGFRMIIEGFGALERFHSLAMPVYHDKPGFQPGRGWSFFPVVLDAFSLIVLVVAVLFALFLLFSVTQ